MAKDLLAQITHVNRAVKVAKDQHERGLNFVSEVIGATINEELESMIREEKLFVSNEYYPVYRGVKFRWRITRARIVTNNNWMCDSVNCTIAGRRVAKTKDNRTIKKAVVDGTVLTRDISILWRDDVNSFSDDNQEARQYWDDLTGKELNCKLVKKTRVQKAQCL